jgi:hypothetical protein
MHVVDGEMCALEACIACGEERTHFFSYVRVLCDGIWTAAAASSVDTTGIHEFPHRSMKLHW